MNNLVNEAIKKILSLIVGVENKCKVMQGATSSAAGKAGLVPAPSAGEAERYLRADGTWVNPKETTKLEVTISKEDWTAQNGAYTWACPLDVTENSMIALVPKYPLDTPLPKGLNITNIVQANGSLTLTSLARPDGDVTILIYIDKEG